MLSFFPIKCLASLSKNSFICVKYENPYSILLFIFVPITHCLDYYSRSWNKLWNKVLLPSNPFRCFLLSWPWKVSADPLAIGIFWICQQFCYHCLESSLSEALSWILCPANFSLLGFSRLLTIQLRESVRLQLGSPLQYFSRR